MSDDDQNDEKPTPTPAADQGILANDHDNDKLGQDIAKLLNGLLQRGVQIDLQRLDLNNLKPRIEAMAACRMLVAKGVCTETELAVFCNQEFKAILAAVLQIVEEQLLAQQGQQIVRGQDKLIKPQGAGKLAIVKH